MSIQPTVSAPRPTTAPVTRSRIVGVDTARGLAIIGMFVAHLSLVRDTGLFTATGWHWLADGRSSALFATLAGVGVAFMTKRAYTTAAPQEWSVQRIRLLKRAGIVFVLGWILTMFGTPVAVILGSYAMLFVLVIPFIKLRPAALLGWAAAVVVVMPPLLLTSAYYLLGGADPYTYDTAGHLLIMVPIVGDLWAGYYPALSWLSYILVGLAVGRLGLTRPLVQVALVAAGVLVAGAGYLPGLALEWETTGLARDLVTIAPHADTTFEIIGNIGVAVAILGVCLLIASLAPLRVLLFPISAMGSMSLTVYCAQIVVIAALGADVVWDPQSNWPLIWLTMGSMIFASGWMAIFDRGPLERLLAIMTRTRPGAPSAVPYAG
ncbi:MAG: heparan-alpha-glucosaminide N-acetyltransferase domain-containing protein [Beutenbergiaceae bacterium]